MEETIKKNKTQRQLNAYYRIKSVLDNPSQINLEETKKFRKQEIISVEVVKARLQKELNILKEKLTSQGVTLK